VDHLLEARAAPGGPEIEKDWALFDQFIEGRFAAAENFQLVALDRSDCTAQIIAGDFTFVINQTEGKSNYYNGSKKCICAGLSTFL
jgi:hypothetical protein